MPRNRSSRRSRSNSVREGCRVFVGHYADPVCRIGLKPIKRIPAIQRSSASAIPPACGSAPQSPSGSDQGLFRSVVVSRSADKCVPEFRKKRPLGGAAISCLLPPSGMRAPDCLDTPVCEPDEERRQPRSAKLVRTCFIPHPLNRTRLIPRFLAIPCFDKNLRLPVNGDEPERSAAAPRSARRTARGGRDSVDHPPGGHDDVANAVAGVAHCAVNRHTFSVTELRI